MQQSLGHWLSNTRQKHHWMLCSILQYSSRLQQFATFLSWGFMMNCLSQFNNYLANFYCAESMPHFSQVTFPFPLNEETSLSLMLPLQWTELDALLRFSSAFQMILESSVVPHPSLHFAFHPSIPKSGRKSPLELWNPPHLPLYTLRPLKMLQDP